VAVAVDALYWAFYKTGIFADCSGEGVNHGVLVTGVAIDHWKIKNSWGIEWGDQGYIKLARGNTCSICEYPYYPVL
jgi:cathepsin S